MTLSVTDLMIRNLADVFGEGDPVRRRAAIAELWAEDGAFYAPDVIHRGQAAKSLNRGLKHRSSPRFHLLVGRDQ